MIYPSVPATVSGRRIRLEVPSIDVCPWVFLKDHKMRYPNGNVMSVMEVNSGHIGFVCETADGWTCEAHVGPFIYALTGEFPTAEDAVAAVIARREKVLEENRK